MYSPPVGDRRTSFITQPPFTQPPVRRPALFAPARDSINNSPDALGDVERLRGAQDSPSARAGHPYRVDVRGFQAEEHHLWDSPEEAASRLRIARDPGRHVLPTCSDTGPTNSVVLEEKPRYQPLSRTTEHVLRMLLDGDLSRVRAESVAEALGISCTTLRRRLRQDHTSYQFLLDRARQFRCEKRLRERWLPGKCLADELGYLEINSFYRAFKRWTGLNYSEYRESFL